jgi:hypothetical protein
MPQRRLRRPDTIQALPIPSHEIRHAANHIQEQAHARSVFTPRTVTLAVGAVVAACPRCGTVLRCAGGVFGCPERPPPVAGPWALPITPGTGAPRSQALRWLRAGARSWVARARTASDPGASRSRASAGELDIDGRRLDPGASPLPLQRVACPSFYLIRAAVSSRHLSAPPIPPSDAGQPTMTRREPNEASARPRR